VFGVGLRCLGGRGVLLVLSACCLRVGVVPSLASFGSIVGSAPVPRSGPSLIGVFGVGLRCLGGRGVLLVLSACCLRVGVVPSLASFGWVVGSAPVPRSGPSLIGVFGVGAALSRWSCCAAGVVGVPPARRLGPAPTAGLSVRPVPRVLVHR
jgi:hypothetical protein